MKMQTPATIGTEKTGGGHAAARLAPALLGVLSALLASACTETPRDAGVVPPDPQYAARYAQEIAAWREQREARLKSPGGWLNLAGLYWLAPGANSIGAGPANDIVVPVDRAAARIGTFFLDGGRVTFTRDVDADVRHGGEPIESMTLEPDDPGPETVLTHEDLAFFVIDRRGSVGVRLRDYRHPAVDTFPGIPAYPTSLEWRVEARFVPYAEPRQIIVDTVVEGLDWDPVAPGILEFDIAGQTLTLETFGSGPSFFVLFADQTSGTETYPAGRYLSVDAAADGEITVIDFNRAYNPPCAFNEFATCPLPPRQNFLPVAIEAGEKYTDALHAASL
jgi:hypothetical protein